MKTYSIHEQPHPVSDRVDRADQLEFVSDGFSWVTAIFPPLGFLAQGLWLPAVGYFLAVGVLVGVASLIGVSDEVVGLLVVALHVFLAFELSTLKRWWLDRQGWTMLGSVSGNSLEECERRFFESWLPEQVAVAQPSVATPISKSALPKTVGWPFTGKA